MSDKHDAGEALRASEERFRALTQISSDWFWEMDREHRFTYLSLETTPDFNTKRAEVIGKTRWELLPEAMSLQDRTHVLFKRQATVGSRRLDAQRGSGQRQNREACPPSHGRIDLR